MPLTGVRSGPWVVANFADEVPSGKRRLRRAASLVPCSSGDVGGGAE